MSHTITLVNGDVIEVTDDELSEFDRCMKAFYTTSKGVRIYKQYVCGIYPPGAEPSDKLIKQQGRKKSSTRRQAGAVAKKTMIERYGEEQASIIVGKGVALPDRINAKGEPRPVSFNRHNSV